MKEIRKDSSRAYAIEVVMFMTYVFFGAHWIGGSALTREIMAHFSIESYAAVSFMTNAVTAAKIVGNFVAAEILRRLFPKKAIGLGAVLIIAGTALSLLAWNFPLFVVGRFIMGFGGALYLVYFSPVVVHYFSFGRRPALNGINSIAYSVGAVLSMVTLDRIFQVTGHWQRTLAVYLIGSVVLFFFWLVLGQDFDIYSARREDTENRGGVASMLKDPFLWRFALIMAGGTTYYIVMMNLFPVYPGLAVDPKTLNALIALGAIGGSFVGSAIASRTKRRLTVVKVFGVLMMISGVLLLLAKSPFLSCVAAFATGALVFLPVSSMLTIPQELPGMTPQKLTGIMGLSWALAYIIESVIYALVSITIDHFGFFAGMSLAILAGGLQLIGAITLKQGILHEREDMDGNA